jgi:hypothetical protein
MRVRHGSARAFPSRPAYLPGMNETAQVAQTFLTQHELAEPLQLPERNAGRLAAATRRSAVHEARPARAIRHRRRARLGEREATCLGPGFQAVSSGISMSRGSQADDTKHTLRRTAATLIEQAAGITLASRFLGHANAQTTR